MPPMRRSDSSNNNFDEMRIFEGRYFNINKKLLMCFGLWPYERKVKKIVLRTIVMGLLTIITIPQLIGIIVHYKNIERLMLGIMGGTVLLVANLKVLGIISEEEKMKAVYTSIANNWRRIEDYRERGILRRYSERARTLTIFYAAWMMSSGVIAATLPLIPKILDFTSPYLYKNFQGFIH